MAMTNFLLSLSLTLLTISSLSALSMNDMPVKRVLVTGGNKGIGKAICARLLADHPDVYVILGSRNAERGELITWGPKHPFMTTLKSTFSF